MRPRSLSFALAALLLATPALAQERPASLADDFRSFEAGENVTLERPAMLPPPAEDATDAAATGAADAEVEAETRSDTPPALAPQEVGSRNWLYLVAAIVAGGIILAVLL